jgi:hypothetical protein
MAREGLPLTVRAGLVLGVLGVVGHLTAEPGDDRSAAVARVLAVQSAMNRGREYLLHQNPRAAIDVLESQLPHVDGNASYLALLRDAYRGHIHDLQLANKSAEAKVYEQRLAILDPAAASTPAAVKPAAAVKEQRAIAVAPAATVQEQRGGRIDSVPTRAAAAQPSVTVPAKTETTAAAPPAKVEAAAVQPPKAEVVAAASRPEAVASAVRPPASSGVIARGYREEEDRDDPFRPLVTERQKQARAFLSDAEQAFTQRHYKEAGRLYQKAHRADAGTVESSRERWAYCMLYHVVEELNQPTFGGPAVPELESEVRLALQLAPRLDYGKTLLAEIDKRRTKEPEVPKGKSLPAVAVKHSAERTESGWKLSETTNFRIYHNQSREYAETVARICEHTRVEMQKKWFGTTGPDWNPRCDVFLYATGEEYSQATQVPPKSPGHSSFRFDENDGHITVRRMDLHCDNINLLKYVLPHETTHTVLAGNFGERPIPRWADEGMAVLTEPDDKVETHLRNLPQHRQKRELFPLRQLLHMTEYPLELGEGYVGAFYAESVSLVEYLVRLKGAQVFTQFVREGMYSGYENAMQRYYGFRTFNEMEEQWVQFAFEGGRARDLARTTSREKER